MKSPNDQELSSRIFIVSSKNEDNSMVNIN